MSSQVNQSNQSKDSTFSIRVDNELLKRMDATLLLAEARSRNDYIKKAIQFYTVYLQLDGDPDVFSKVVGDIVEAKMNFVVKSTEADRKQDVEKLARNQFKIATELAKIALIIGDNLNVPYERMSDWHIKAVEEVRSLNGVLSFEERGE